MGIYKGLARAALTAGVVAGVLIPVGGTAVAAPSTGASTAAAACSYIVMYDGLAVRENPSPNSVVRKYKAKGSKVTGPCARVVHEDSGEPYIGVDCSCATEGLGWMRARYLAAIIS